MAHIDVRIEPPLERWYVEQSTGSFTCFAQSFPGSTPLPRRGDACDPAVAQPHNAIQGSDNGPCHVRSVDVVGAEPRLERDVRSAGGEHRHPAGTDGAKANVNASKPIDASIERARALTAPQLAQKDDRFLEGSCSPPA